MKGSAILDNFFQIFLHNFIGSLRDPLIAGSFFILVTVYIGGLILYVILTLRTRKAPLAEARRASKEGDYLIVAILLIIVNVIISIIAFFTHMPLDALLLLLGLVDMIFLPYILANAISILFARKRMKEFRHLGSHHQHRQR